jgi:rhodanese-related sulfurtransferase
MVLRPVMFLRARSAHRVGHHACPWRRGLRRLHIEACMKRYIDLLADAKTRVAEAMPWDLHPRLTQPQPPLWLDVREPAEFARVCLPGSVNVPRGLLEQACEWDFDETVPALAGGRDTEIVVVCRSGNRSLLAADLMLTLGFRNVVSLQTGLRGWNDADLPLVNASGQTLLPDAAETLLAAHVRADQRRPVGLAASLRP